MTPMETEASFSLQRRREAPRDEYPLAEVSLGLLLHVKSHVPMPEAALSRLALREMRRLVGEAEARHLKINQVHKAQAAPDQPGTPQARQGGGRRPSPATVVLREAMVKDAQAGQSRSRADYLAILREADGPESDNAAGIIVNREAKRAFGHPLPRTKKVGGRKKGGGRVGGRQASPATSGLRERLQQDQEAGEVRNAAHYMRWLADKHSLGLKRARPLVYRELAAIRKTA